MIRRLERWELPILTTEPYAAAVAKAVEVVDQYRKKGHDTRWINLGGGFGIHYRKSEGLPASAYAKVIVPTTANQGGLSASCRGSPGMSQSSRQPYGPSAGKVEWIRTALSPLVLHFVT